MLTEELTASKTVGIFFLTLVIVFLIYTACFPFRVR